MHNKRKEAFRTAPAELNGKELRAHIIKEAGYTEAQNDAQRRAGFVYRDYRFASMQLLSETQRAALPAWAQKDFKISSELKLKNAEKLKQKAAQAEKKAAREAKQKAKEEKKKEAVEK